MALSPCRGCGNLVDQMAKTCPKCGRSYPAARTSIKVVYVITVLAVVGAVYWQCSSGCDDLKRDLRAPAGAAR